MRFRRSAARQAEGETLTNPQALRDEGPEESCFGSWLRLCSERTPSPENQLFAFEAQRLSSAACMEWRSHGMQVGWNDWLCRRSSQRASEFDRSQLRGWRPPAELRKLRRTKPPLWTWMGAASWIIGAGNERRMWRLRLPSEPTRLTGRKRPTRIGPLRWLLPMWLHETCWDELLSDVPLTRKYQKNEAAWPAGITPKLSRLHGVAKPRNAGRLQRLVGPRGFLARTSLHDSEPGDFAACHRSLEWTPAFHGSH